MATTRNTTTTPEKKIYTEAEQVIINRMDEAAKEDRERFFVVADAMTMQPKYKDRMTELETVKQAWRDMTIQPNYPEITWPMALPDWFPTIKFASCWGPTYLADTLAMHEREAAIHMPALKPETPAAE